MSGYCCGMPPDERGTKATGCPQCKTAFRLCLKEYQQNTATTQPGVLQGCSFGNVSSEVMGDSSFVLSEPETGSLVLPFSFRWTVSWCLFNFLYLSQPQFIAFLWQFAQQEYLIERWQFFLNFTVDSFRWRTRGLSSPPFRLGFCSILFGFLF